MATATEIFATAPTGWVSLAVLFQRIEQQLGISQDVAINALRAPFEAFSVQTDVVGWDPHNLGAHIRADGWTLHWAIERPDGTGFSVSEAGWKHVNLDNGMLNGHPVRLLWQDVVRELAHLDNIEHCQLLDHAPDLPKEIADDTKALAALHAMSRYAEDRRQASGGVLPKREDVARHASRVTGYAVRKATFLYRFLPDHLRNQPRRLKS